MGGGLNIGVVIGGIILHTNDGGERWEKQKEISGNNLHNVYFIDSNEGWAIGGDYPRVILHTKDGGKKWEEQIGTPGRLSNVRRGIYFLNNNEGWVVGKSGTILYTENGGKSWQPQDSGTSVDLNSICYDGKNTLWVVGDWNTILKYTDPTLRSRSTKRAVERSDKLVTRWGNIKSTSIESALYNNFPNPFNPDTWIPFRLAHSSFVTIHIYDSGGKLIRILSLGQIEPGLYLSKDKAAYWDGRNEGGESVSSGIYFYTLQVGKFKATKKMCILK